MLKYVLILFCLFSWSHQTLAVGFGQASLHSHLGEALDVSMPLIMEKGEDIRQFSVQLASPSEYQNLEQTIPKSYHHIRVDVEISPLAVPKVLIHSSYAVDEAILVLVLKVKRGRGIFYKKMQFFLDAADIKPTTKTAWMSRPSQQVEYIAAKQNRDAAVAAPFTRKAGSTASYQRSDDWARRSSYGPVQYGDSLSEIAYRLRKDKRYSNHQVMLALFDANPKAFVNQDINQLKKGSFLQVPDDAALQNFIKSARHQSLKALKLSKKTKESKKKSVPVQHIAPETTASPQFRGRISLGLHEDLAAAHIDPEVLQRLDKLEPMYQQAMATGLRLDGMGGKVDALAKEVAQLRDKVDALARVNPKVIQGNTSYGWFWFIGLLLLNGILFAAYFYRKQMKLWQNKLVEAQQSMPYSEQETDGQAEVNQRSTVADAPMMPAETRQSTGLDAHDSMVGDDISGSHDHHELEVISIDDLAAVVKEDPEDYVSLFEEAVHKKNWLQAEKYYALMGDKESSRPRIQALWVQKLHASNNIIERNITLLNLSRLYEHEQWHRFCSYFDQDVWHELQDEKVISYTGRVVELEMDKMNQQLMLDESGIDESDPILDLSATGTFDITVQDFQVSTKDNDANPMQDTWDEKRADSEKQGEQGLNDDSIVDTKDIEPIADIITDEIEQGIPEGTATALNLDFDFELEIDASQQEPLPRADDMVNGEDDTVLVTPETLEAMEEVAKGSKASDVYSAQKHEPYPNDEGDTV
ncbi:MAG: FimV/HubP family polar landmark protein, partial [Ghiorsea sp.]|nr:FimV/HubP family polar landmark protein [Ghiorsea sp.]